MDTRSCLTEILSGGRQDVHNDLRKLFAAEVFDNRSGLGAREAAELIYERLRFLAGRLEPARQIVADPYRLCAMHEWAVLTDIGLAVAITVHYNLCLGSILAHGQGRDDLLQIIADLEAVNTVGVFLATELGYGNNLVNLETVASFEAGTGEFVLHTPTARARKFMSGTALPGVAKTGVVLARLVVEGEDRGVFPFLVPIRDVDGMRPGVTSTALPDKPALFTDNAVTSFDEVRLPGSALLVADALPTRNSDSGLATTARERFLKSAERIQIGKLFLATSSAAAARAATTIASRHGHRRRTFAPGHSDVAVVSYRSHQKALLDALSDTYGITLLTNAAKRLCQTWWHEPRSPRRALIQRLAVTKAVVTWTAGQVLIDCRERLGAQGMFSANRIADFVVFNWITVTGEGDNVVVLAKTAREMLELRDYAPPVSQPDHPVGPDLLDPRLWLHLFRERERIRHQRCAARWQDSRTRKSDPLEAWNECVNDALRFGEAHGARLLLEEFVSAASNTPDPQAKHLLHGLGAIYALRQISQDAAWFVAEKLLTPEQCGALPDTMESCYAELAPMLPLLVEAFDIPDDVLRAPAAAAGEPATALEPFC
ncbi:MAG TPA: acyl-CoA dehydrogenase [Actinophytocola sp.]|uniref:acyl-CoA dehydrogenase family protein n=1 Tax=Actinophytocola sp. TaxID=1872138 RepID=UPI002E0A471E|nr:acyl-CoA dehydrogenase [Actinophytocola sp.]